MSLDVYLRGRRIGALHPGTGSEYSFAYSPELADGAPRSTQPLSYSLPVRAEPYGPEEIRPYVEGLLPEGERREEIARQLGVDPGDSYALIGELGHDCPGAVVFLPPGRTPEHREPDLLAWLGEDELEEAVGERSECLFDPGCEPRMRFALPGKRHKLALIRDQAEDRWAWPEPGAPSTHIVKPVSEECADFALNELACTMALRELGLPVAHAELATIAGRLCLVSKRFDRWGESAGAERLHQESFAQALGYLPDDIEGRGPGYAEASELLSAIGEEDSIESLFTISYCCFLIGCTDEVHSKHSSLLYTAEGPLLGPFYDIASTSVYEDQTEPRSLEEHVYRDSCLACLARVAIECNYPLEPSILMAIDTIAGLWRALDGVASRAQAEGWYAPVIDEVLQRVFSCLESLRDEMQILKPPGPLR